ncbi:MAG: DEAD/DEAH box helicase [Mogibacterium sp.]|nr:DEAD/DEAH box helicase [Mogibacterium sp.]
MSGGANFVHSRLKQELEDYIRSQYFGKSRILLNASEKNIDAEGLLYRKPYIESSPSYKQIPGGLFTANIPEWLRSFFQKLAEAGLGVYSSPFTHQVEALELALKGEDIAVSTGTGSGKTECFMWPMLAKLADEARNSPDSWQHRGVRTIIMYPMNALVSDQLSRMRKIMGDIDGKFLDTFRKTCGESLRRPQFGMYTGRTPYSGNTPELHQDRELEDSLAEKMLPESEAKRRFCSVLSSEGKLPAKSDIRAFLERLHEGIHSPDEDDAELVTRFEMQKYCPDILITNYSMLEYMLMRPIEAGIWDATQKAFSLSRRKMLFIIDEAHMYRGSAGGETALLIRRFMHRLGLTRENMQFIVTTASMPDSSQQDRENVMHFLNDLTSSGSEHKFFWLRGERENIAGLDEYDMPASKFMSCSAEKLESPASQLNELNALWSGIPQSPAPFSSLPDAREWMYKNLVRYAPFNKLMTECRGSAKSVDELAALIFPAVSEEYALQSLGVLLAVAALARGRDGSVLFPARMHMLFRGIKGVYACTNENCPHSHHDGGLTLGEIFLSDGKLNCPECGSAVYELYNDRRCGALFFRGYILENEIGTGTHSYLWHYPGYVMDANMKEIHLYIPPENFRPSSKKLKPCYLDVSSGFIDFTVSVRSLKPGTRKLYYCDYSVKGKPQVITFPSCPHCGHVLSRTQLTSFNTRGNQSFFNLIHSQFRLQPPVHDRTQDSELFPNEGRKTLLFSDSRQRAAKLARDMSEISEAAAVRQLFMLAVSLMDKSERSGDYSLHDIYGYFCLAAGMNNVQILHGAERAKFYADCTKAQKRYTRKQPVSLNMSSAAHKVQGYLMMLFCGGYNTLYESALCWLEPTEKALLDVLDELEDCGVKISEKDFRELFSAWVMSVCDSCMALGHIIPDTTRMEVRACYEGYGLIDGWRFSKNIMNIMGWKADSPEAAKIAEKISGEFTETSQHGSERSYINLEKVYPCIDPKHTWFKCECCSEISPYMLRKHCPVCGSEEIHHMTAQDFEALRFWRKPAEDALNGAKVHVLDTEEHTAQISRKDQRDDLWSKTEKYELRFQDMLDENETPVDILSSTTTMEVGIDIGSLVAIGLRNIPPTRENYQQRAGRAGRRGAVLSTIITFCEDGPHDSLYFRNPVPMLRGEPGAVWVDVHNEKLLHRHMNMIVLQEFLRANRSSLDTMSAEEFLTQHWYAFTEYLKNYDPPAKNSLLMLDELDVPAFRKYLIFSLRELKAKLNAHPELFSEYYGKTKSLLDALYEEGIIPTYSFPKNVVSMYVMHPDGRIMYQAERGLDVAIGEYAPGRSVVIDKLTYQIGGIYYPGIERASRYFKPAEKFMHDPNYLKEVIKCEKCGWFGLAEEGLKVCPFCGNAALSAMRPMLRPWGFAPRNAEPILEAQLVEEYTRVQTPLYSTLPEADSMTKIPGCKNIRMASRTNQRIIMLNTGQDDKGFMVCDECGAAMPSDDSGVLKGIGRPYKSRFMNTPCRHHSPMNVNLGYDFITDMLVLEFALDADKINTAPAPIRWLEMAGHSLAEALRLAACEELDIEFTELVTGCRIRRQPTGKTYADIYIYDSLSSGAGYSAGVQESIPVLFERIEAMLSGCKCDGACYKCLKHYRNQHVHSVLDRFYAIQLLNWGRYGTVEERIDTQTQRRYIAALEDVLREYDCEISYIDEGLAVNGKTIEVYPAMLPELSEKGKIFVSDELMRFARPYAVRKITREAKA